jgi:hypothetical protein
VGGAVGGSMRVVMMGGSVVVVMMGGSMGGAVRGPMGGSATRFAEPRVEEERPVVHGVGIGTPLQVQKGGCFRILPMRTLHKGRDMKKGGLLQGAGIVC